MKKIFSAIIAMFLCCSTAFSACDNCSQNSNNCSYRMQKKMLHNHKMIKNKVINAQVKGKMLAIQELSKEDYSNNPETKQKIACYQKQIEDLTNQKMCLKKEYKTSLQALKASR